MFNGRRSQEIKVGKRGQICEYQRRLWDEARTWAYYKKRVTRKYVALVAVERGLYILIKRKSA